MKIKQLLAGIFPVLDGDARKKHTARAVLNGPIEHRGVLNVHRVDPNNVGDYYCAPHHYFPELQSKAIDIGGMRKTNVSLRRLWAEAIRSHDLIIGGGGLLNIPHFAQQLKLFETLGSRGKKTVLWGPGHNDPAWAQFKVPAQYKVDLDKFGLVGLRDYSAPGQWVPCVSCMHPIFNQSIEPTHEYGVLMGKKSAQNKDRQALLSQVPYSHNATDLNEMVRFIGSCDTLVTDSYHAMYWGLLMQRKVLVIPTTTKFLDFKYPVPVTHFESFKQDLNKAITYDGLLEECRSINQDFAKKVFDFLSIDRIK